MESISFWRHVVFSAILGFMCNPANASNFQSFSGLSYSNGAELAFSVKKMQLIVSNDYIIPHIRFDGILLTPDPAFGNNIITSGSVTNLATFNLTFGRFAVRLSNQWLLNLDISQPYKGSIEYPMDSFVRYDTIATDITSIYFTPNLIYQMSGKLNNLAVAGGVDYLRVNAGNYQNYPSLPIPQPFGSGVDNVVINRLSAGTYAWHLAASYRMLENTFFGLSYFSRATPKLIGNSTFSGFPDSDHLNAILKLPSTSILSIREFFTKEWMTLFQVRYTDWSRLNQITLYHVAGPTSTVTSIFNFKNTWETDLTSTYYLLPQFLVGGGISYDQTPTVFPTSRRLNLPEVDQYAITFLLGYQLNKSVMLEFNYSHVFMVSKIAINHVNPEDGALDKGTATASSDSIGFQMTIEI